MNQNQKIFNRSFILMLWTGFLLFMSIMMISPIFAGYAMTFNISGSVIGFMAGLFSMSSLIIRPICGKAVDLKSKKKILMGSYFTVAIAMLGYAWTTSVPMLFVFRIIHGLGWGFASTTSMTVAIDALPKKHIASGIGFYTMMQTAASTIAPMVGLAIANHYGYRATYFIGSLMSFAGMAMTPFVVTTAPKHGHLTLRGTLQIKELFEMKAALPALVTCCNAMAGAAIGTFLALYAAKLGIVDFGLYFSVSALTMLMTRPFLGYLTERFGLMKVIIPCELMIAGSVIALGQVTNLAGILIVAVMMGIASTGSAPALMASCINSTTEEKRGTATSTSYVGLDSGLFLGSFIAGILINWIGFAGAFSFFAIPVFISMMLFAQSSRTKSEPPQTIFKTETV